MLVECCRYILVECPTCNKVKEYDLNYFEFESEGFLEFKCECNDVNGRISKLDKNNLLLNIHCTICEKVHIYKLRIDNLFNNNTGLSCQSGGRICIVGDRNIVDKIKNKNIKEPKGADELALLVKKLYTLDESKDISCTCGNNNLIAKIYPNRVYFKCSVCNEESFISIESSQDLRLILGKDKIVIGREDYLLNNLKDEK